METLHPRTILLTRLLATVLLIATAGMVLLRLITPTDGAILDPRIQSFTSQGVIVTPLNPETSALRPGDIVLAVEGQRIEDLAQDLWNLRNADWKMGQQVTYRLIRDDREIDVEVRLQRFPILPLLSYYAVGILACFILLGVATFICWQKPELLAGWTLLIFGTGYLAGLTWVFGLQVSDFVSPTGFWMYKLVHFFGFHTMGIAMFYFALVFPQVHPIVRKHPIRLFLLILSPSLLYLAYGIFSRPFAGTTLSWLGGWFTLDGPFNLPRFVLIVGACIANYRIARTNVVARQQIRWILLGLSALALTIGIFWIMPLWLLGHPLPPSNLISISVLFLPVSLAIAILRYQLFDIDLILSRTLTYGFLTLIIITFYVGTVAGVTWLFNTEPGNLFTSLVVTGVVAVLFQPLRDRLQRWVNRVVYDERDLPYQILARLASRLERVEATEAILPAIVETVAHTLKLPSIALAIRDGDQFHIAAVYPLPGSHDFSANAEHRPNHMTLPIIYQSELIGKLILDPPAVGESFTETDIRLLEDIARQAGPAVYSVRLTTDLQHSRERLITAREEERRRIRRDLHDGLGPQLASQMLTLDAVLKLLERDPTAATQLLHDLKTQARDALTSIRELVYDLRPPALDELGLVGALQERALQARHMRTEITVDTPDAIPSLPAAVEVALYRIAQEAITNVTRHAKATDCRVLLRPCDDGYRSGLMLEVKDNGSGLPNTLQHGMGMVSMRERAEELGGSCKIESIPGSGVTISVWLPLLEVEND